MEADTFWCMNNLLDGIQDNYTFAQPGVQNKVNQLRELTKRVDGRDFNSITCYQLEGQNVCLMIYLLPTIVA